MKTIYWLAPCLFFKFFAVAFLSWIFCLVLWKVAPKLSAKKRLIRFVLWRKSNWSRYIDGEDLKSRDSNYISAYQLAAILNDKMINSKILFQQVDCTALDGINPLHFQIFCANTNKFKNSFKNSNSKTTPLLIVQKLKNVNIMEIILVHSYHFPMVTKYTYLS